MARLFPVKREREYKVAVSEGGQPIQYFKVTNRFNYNNGYVYEYKNREQQVDIVLVPLQYKYGEINGELIIGKNAGNCSAAVMVGDEYIMGKSTDTDAPGFDAALLYRTHVTAIGYKTLYEKNVPWKWLIIGIGLLVVVVAVVWFVKGQGG